MKKIVFGVLLVFLFLGAFVSCTTEEVTKDSNDSSVAASYVRNDVFDYNTVELEIEQLLNEYRVAKGLNPLEKINHISNVSNGHNDYMISINTLTHALFAQRKENLKITLGAVAVGENIAYNYSSAQSVMDAWINSPAHKANMEGNYTHFGIAVKTDSQGKRYFTNMFIRK